jgi:tRNA nucleotidyltransferase/poly(A) polymerase
LAEDAMRRDFTINALYLDVDGNLYDPTGRGVYDLGHPYIQLNTILDPQESYMEDPFRIFRYLNLQSKGYNGALQCSDIEAILKHLHTIFQTYQTAATTLSENERVAKVSLYQRLDGALCKMFLDGRAIVSMDILHQVNFFKIFYPLGNQLNTNWSHEWFARAMLHLDAMSSNSNKRIHFYSLVLTNMLGMETDNIEERMKAQIAAHAFPIDMNWKMNAVHVESLIAAKKVHFDCRKLAEIIDNRIKQHPYEVHGHFANTKTRPKRRGKQTIHHSSSRRAA